MPRTKSAKKRLRQTIKRTIRNRQIKSRVKNSIKKFLELIKDKKIEEAKEKLPEVIKIIDSAWSKGVWHKNKVSREKSKIMKKLNQAEKEISEEQSQEEKANSAS